MNLFKNVSLQTAMLIMAGGCAAEPSTAEQSPALETDVVRAREVEAVDLLVVGTNELKDGDGVGGVNALRIRSRIEGGGTQLMIDQDNYSNPVSALGGLIPGSDTDPTRSNYGTKQGEGLSYNKFPVGFNGQTHPLHSIDVLSDENGVTADDSKVYVRWASIAGFDTSIRPIMDTAGVDSHMNARHRGGSNPLHAIGGLFEATIEETFPGDRAYALQTRKGEVWMQGPVEIGVAPGNPRGQEAQRVPVVINSDSVKIQGSPTTAVPGITGTQMEVRTGGPRNYVSFGNPDCSIAGFVYNNESNSGDAWVTYRRCGGSFNGLEFGAQNDTRIRVSSEGMKVFSSIGIGFGANDPIWTQGNGSPEGVVAAAMGSYYSRTDAAAGPRWYVKEYGANLPFGWVAK